MADIQVEIAKLKDIIRRYRHPKNLEDVHVSCYVGPSDARGDLGVGWDDDRCELCKEADKVLEAQ